VKLICGGEGYLLSQRNIKPLIVWQIVWRGFSFCFPAFPLFPLFSFDNTPSSPATPPLWDPSVKTFRGRMRGWKVWFPGCLKTSRPYRTAFASGISADGKDRAGEQKIVENVARYPRYSNRVLANMSSCALRAVPLRPKYPNQA
jgi:hypothetical protein